MVSRQELATPNSTSSFLTTNGSTFFNTEIQEMTGERLMIQSAHRNCFLHISSFTCDDLIKKHTDCFDWKPPFTTSTNGTHYVDDPTFCLHLKVMKRMTRS